MNFVARGARNTRPFKDITYSVPWTLQGICDTLHLFKRIAGETIDERLEKRFVGTLVGVTKEQTESLRMREPSLAVAATNEPPPDQRHVSHPEIETMRVETR